MTRILLVSVLALLCCCSAERGREDATALPDFDVLWDYNRPDTTEARFREILPLAESSGDASYRAQLTTQIARAQGLQMKFDEAHRTLDRVRDMLTEDLVAAKIRYLLERGRVFNSSGLADSARPLFLEAWEAGLAAGEDYYAVDAAHMMAIIEPVEDQLVWAGKAMEVAEQSSDERARGWLGSLYNNTGWTYHDLGDYEKALDLFEKALAWNKEKGNEERVRIARWTVARAYRSLGRVEEALAVRCHRSLRSVCA